MKRRALACIMAASLCASMGITIPVQADAEVGVGEGEVVTIWECNWGGENYQAALEKLAQQATEANIDGKGYKVEVSMVAWDNFNETFLTAVTAGSAPDIAWEASTGPLQYALMGEALDLTPIKEAWEEEGNLIAEEIPQAAWDFESYNGEIVGLPVAVDGGGWIYRKDIFEAAGINVDEFDQTYEGFREICRKLVDYGVDAAAVDGGTPASVAGFQRFWHLSNGTGTYDEDNGVLIDSEPNRYVYNFVKELYDEGLIAQGLMGYDTSDMQRLFLDGEIAMIYSRLPNFVPDDMLDKVGILPPFYGPNAEEHLTGSGYQAYHAFNQSGHPEATLAVLKWWIENNDILWTEGNNATCSIRPSKLSITTTNELAAEFAATFLTGNQAVPDSIYPRKELPEFQTALETAGPEAIILSAIFTGGDLEEAIQREKEEVEEIIADYE